MPYAVQLWKFECFWVYELFHDLRPYCIHCNTPVGCQTKTWHTKVLTQARMSFTSFHHCLLEMSWSNWCHHFEIGDVLWTCDLTASKRKPLSQNREESWWQENVFFVFITSPFDQAQGGFNKKRQTEIMQYEAHEERHCIVYIAH